MTAAGGGDLAAAGGAEQQVVAPTEDGKPFDEEDAQLELSAGLPRFYIMRLPPRGRRFSRITYHARVTQCLGGVQPRAWYLGVAVPTLSLDRPPAQADLVAFRIPHGVCIKLHRGTWHAGERSARRDALTGAGGPLFDGEAMDFINLENADTNVTDHNTHHFRGFEYEINVYSVALYAEERAAVTALAALHDAGDDALLQGLLDWDSTKALVIRFARHVSGKEFVQHFDAALKPRMRRAGEPRAARAAHARGKTRQRHMAADGGELTATDEESALEELRAFFAHRPLAKGSEVVLLWALGHGLEVAACPAGAAADSCAAGPAQLRVQSVRLAQAVFDNYLGSSSPAPQARRAWVAALRELLGADPSGRRG
eukprot:scaffold16.g122.t1